MNWRQAKQLVVLAETLHFRRAAERLHMAQPPLSMSIKRLEEELRAPLFFRERRGLRLTPVGESVLPHARQVVFHIEQMKAQAASAAGGLAGQLSIAFVGSATYRLFPRALPEFRRRYPLVQLVLREGTTTQMLRQVERGDLDLGLVRYPVLEPTSARLVPVELDQLLAALPRGSTLARRKPLRLQDLAGQGFILYAAGAASNLRSQVVSACQAAGFDPRVVQEAVQVQTLLSLVASGMGVALVPSVSQAHRMPGVVFRQLDGVGDRLDVAIAAATHPETEAPAATHFRELLLSLGERGQPGRPLVAPT
jgi:DNA-binding transcriptional LysR family regulator